MAASRIWPGAMNRTPTADVDRTETGGSKTWPVNPSGSVRVRRTSAPDRPGSKAADPEDEAETLVPHRKQKKIATMPPPRGTVKRYDALAVAPEALAHLHKLHEVFMKIKSQKDVSVVLEDASDEAIEAAWGVGGNGSWLVHGELPAPGKERPFASRTFKSFPANAVSAFANTGVAAITTKGKKGWGDTAIGQDNVSISHFASGWDCYCCMDGHGFDGHWPSTRTVKTIPFFLQSSGCATMLKQNLVEAALIRAFEKAEKDLERKSRREALDLQASGCTAVCALYNKETGSLFVGTAGDSRAVLIAPARGVIFETRDHKPSVESEKRRIEASGGEVVRTEYEDGFVEERINIRGDTIPGICMTRSLGDFCVKSCGVIAEPEVVEWSISDVKDPYLFVACDGVFDFLETDVVAETLLREVAAGGSATLACQKVLKLAREAWNESEPDYCDDISMILVPLTGEAKKHSSGGCAAGLAKCASLCSGK